MGDSCSLIFDMALVKMKKRTMPSAKKSAWSCAVLVALSQISCDQGQPPAAVEEAQVQISAAAETIEITKARELPAINDSDGLSVAMQDFPAEDIRAKLMMQGTAVWRKWMPSFYTTWGQLDGEAAIESALAEENSLRSRAAGAVLSAWSRTDLPAAQNWVHTLPTGRAQVTFANIVIRNMESPRDAATWLSQLNPEAVSNLSDVVSQIGRRWINEDPGAALSWLVSMPDESMREKATMRTFFQWAKTDPESASEFLAQMDPAESFYSLAAEGLARAVSVIDAEGALAWAEQVDPERRDHSGLYETILSGAREALGQPANTFDGETVESAPSPLAR